MDIRVRTLSELLSMQQEDVQFLVEPRLLAPGSSLFIYGEAETWKTWLAMDLAFALAKGGKWLDYFQCKRCKVLMLQSEEPEKMFGDRVGAWVAAHRNGSNPADTESPMFWTENELGLGQFYGQALLEQAVSDYLPAVVIIDNLTLAVDGPLDEPMSRAVIKTCRKLQEKFGVAFVIIHHDRKPTTDLKGTPLDMGFQEMYGPGIFNKWAKAIIKSSAFDKDNDVIKLSIQKHSYRNIAALPDMAMKWNRSKMKFNLAFGED